ncbi:MAG TPA: rRNA pseudouridine synthase [Candidatus Scatomorpha merdavium]|nr:pseudouridine synthase [Oscillospiraceae bacterium]HIS15987.1 rRNA pseudouridine synthase [Candidatus Scatomorpha merdavium]
MKERLQKLISSAGLASRRAAEELIKQGRVKVNGETASLGMSADPELDDIRVNGKRLRISGTRVYIMLNKPRGYVTTLSDEKGRKTVAELVKGAGRRLYPVGRLDLNSEGLLIMTDDGEAANALMHPSHEVGKTYRVTVSGREPEAAVRELEALREVEGEPIRPAQVSFAGETGEGKYMLDVTIHEGRNRQVRKMCAAAGLEVRRLVRIAEGELSLGGLQTGKWRHLTSEELDWLLKLS